MKDSSMETIGAQSAESKYEALKQYLAELGPSEFSRFMEDDVRSKVHQALKEMGFTYVTLDIAGYRTGSMNETLTEEEKA